MYTPNSGFETAILVLKASRAALERAPGEHRANSKQVSTNEHHYRAVKRGPAIAFSVSA